MTGQLKPALIDLELLKRTTRGKVNNQPERLSEWARKGCDSLNCSITKEGAEKNPKRFFPANRGVTNLSRTDKMAFLEGSKVVIDGALRSLTNSLASKLFRSGTGSIGSIATGGITAGVITLANSSDVVQFEVNMVLQANATDGGATPRSALGYVIAVNRSAGTVTVSTSSGGSAGSPSGWQAGDYLLVQGDNNNALKGLAAWIPSTAPTSSDSFFGVNRSADTVRLAGLPYPGTSQSIEEALIDSSSLLAREGGRPNVGVTNFTSYSALEKALGAKVQYVDLSANADIAFRGIMVNGAASTIKVFPDRYCQATTLYLLQMDTWCLESLGDAPQILRYGDGLTEENYAVAA